LKTDLRGAENDVELTWWDSRAKS